jgi:hypothetical protein
LRNLGVDMRMILKWILNNRLEAFGLHSSVTGWEPVAVSCEHGNEPSNSIKCG